MEIVFKTIADVIEKTPPIIRERLYRAWLSLKEKSLEQSLSEDELNFYKRHGRSWRAMDSEILIKEQMSITEKYWFLCRANSKQRKDWMQLILPVSGNTYDDLAQAFDLPKTNHSAIREDFATIYISQLNSQEPAAKADFQRRIEAFNRNSRLVSPLNQA